VAGKLIVADKCNDFVVAVEGVLAEHFTGRDNTGGLDLIG